MRHATFRGFEKNNLSGKNSPKKWLKSQGTKWNNYRWAIWIIKFCNWTPSWSSHIKLTHSIRKSTVSCVFHLEKKSNSSVFSERHVLVQYRCDGPLYPPALPPSPSPPPICSGVNSTYIDDEVSIIFQEERHRKNVSCVCTHATRITDECNKNRHIVTFCLQ